MLETLWELIFLQMLLLLFCTYYTLLRRDITALKTMKRKLKFSGAPINIAHEGWECRFFLSFFVSPLPHPPNPTLFLPIFLPFTRYGNKNKAHIPETSTTAQNRGKKWRYILIVLRYLKKKKDKWYSHLIKLCQLPWACRVVGIKFDFVNSMGFLCTSVGKHFSKMDRN